MVRFSGGALSALLLLSSSASAAVFVSSVSQYDLGTVASGYGYTNPSAALGKPQPIVGAATAYASILSPFSPHYEPDQLTGIGLGGSITYAFPQAVAVTHQPQIGVFTYAGLYDSDYPNGTAASPATTFASAEYNAHPSALIAVGADLDHMQSLGRVVLDTPANYYANAAGPYDSAAPQPAVEADFNKPFTGASFNGQSFAQVLQTLDGSVGGTWLSIPANLGLSSINYIRFSDPQWQLADGSYADAATSIYLNQQKSADLLINAVWAVPEPTTALLLIAPAALLLLRRQPKEGV